MNIVESTCKTLSAVTVAMSRFWRRSEPKINKILKVLRYFPPFKHLRWMTG